MTAQQTGGGPPSTVAVTGAAGYIGKRLVERLLREDSVRRIVGVDIRPSIIEDVRYTHVQQDIRAPLGAVFENAGVEVAAHLAFVLRQTRKREEGWGVNVGGAASLLRACESADVRRVVLMSSATVYGPRPGNPDALTEEAALYPPKGFAYAEDKAACEEHFLRFQKQGNDREVSVLRGCVVMGPNASNFITSALDKPLLIGVRGADPAMQFVHEDDLVDLLARFMTESHPGVYNVAAPGGVRWSEVVAMAGKRMLSLPASLAYGLTNLAWTARAQSDAPAIGLDFIRWPWTVSTAKLEAELGHHFAHSSRAALESYLQRG